MNHKINVRYKQNRSISRLQMYFAVFLLSLFLASCQGKAEEQNNTKVTDVPSDPSGTDLIDNTDNMAQEPTPAERPASVSIEQAGILILNHIDFTTYSLETLDDSLTIGTSRFYAFLIREKNVTHFPVVLVDKDSPSVYCYDEDGTTYGFERHPLYRTEPLGTYDWNGSYVHYDAAGNPAARIAITAADSPSFLFRLEAGADTGISAAAGTAEYTSNSAVYSVDGSPAMHFSISENALLLLYASTDTANGTSSTHIVLFYKEGPAAADAVPAVVHTTQDAIGLFHSLTKEQAALPDEIAAYSVEPENASVFVNGEKCYSIHVYKKLENRKEFIRTYYVSADIQRIYMYDAEQDADVLIFGTAVETEGEAQDGTLEDAEGGADAGTEGEAQDGTEGGTETGTKE